MSIEIGSKWVKDGEVVEVERQRENHFSEVNTLRIDCVWFFDKEESIHVLTERDFLEQYKPEPVYEYKYAYDTGVSVCISNRYYTDLEFKAETVYEQYQRLDFTKIERKQ